jgi:hypothetical protein
LHREAFLVYNQQRMLEPPSVSQHNWRGKFNLDSKSSTADQPARESAKDAQARAEPVPESGALAGDELAYELGVWLRALRSFFQVRNHPFTESERAKIPERNWSNEIRMTRQALLRSSQLTLRLMMSPKGGQELFENVEDAANLDMLSQPDAPSPAGAEADNHSLVELASALSDICTVSEALLEAPAVSFHAWTSFGSIVMRELDRSERAQELMESAYQRAAAHLSTSLLELTRAKIAPATLSADILIVFSDLARLLEHLRLIEDFLRRDHPLKQTLPLFTLVHEDAQALHDFIETRALRIEGMEHTVFDTLDGTNYAIAMELRKVFAHELMGLTALHQAPPIYVKIQNAHGLLRDCFQQSTVALAQLFDDSLDGAQLFESFHTKLEQSLLLRYDLWMLLQLVRQAREARGQYPLSRILERLAAFREGSLRYLMYKDWEACERFMEEVAAARGAVELGPVLHRFATYLETLHEHVSLRAVLAGHPFDYPEPEN